MLPFSGAPILFTQYFIYECCKRVYSLTIDLRTFFFQKLTVAYYLYVAKHDKIIRIAINIADKIATISSISRFLEIRFAQVGRETIWMYTKAS